MPIKGIKHRILLMPNQLERGNNKMFSMNEITNLIHLTSPRRVTNDLRPSFSSIFFNLDRWKGRMFSFEIFWLVCHAVQHILFGDLDFRVKHLIFSKNFLLLAGEFFKYYGFISCKQNFLTYKRKQSHEALPIWFKECFNLDKYFQFTLCLSGEQTSWAQLPGDRL